MHSNGFSSLLCSDEYIFNTLDKGQIIISRPIYDIIKYIWGD